MGNSMALVMVMGNVMVMVLAMVRVMGNVMALVMAIVMVTVMRVIGVLGCKYVVARGVRVRVSC
jgi:hypothetical protein